MKMVKKVLLWVVVALFVAIAIAALPHMAAVLGFLTVALLLPIEKWQALIGKVIRGKWKGILAVVLVVATLFTLPVSDVSVPTDASVSSGATTISTTAATAEGTTASATSATKKITTQRDTTATTRKITTAPTAIITTKKPTTTTAKRITTPTKAPTTSAATMVWVPRNGGKKYHCKSDCSNMIDPEYVTLEEAKARDFTACGRCYK